MLLRALQERSLVIASGAEGQERFRLLEPVREFAAERLEEPLRGEMESRHTNVYIRLAEQARPLLQGPEAAVWLSRLEAEEANLRACLDRVLARQEVESALRLCACLQPFWWMRGDFAEGRRYSAAALQMPGGHLPTLLRGNALGGAGVLARRHGDYREASRLFEEAWRSGSIWKTAGTRPSPSTT